jgi:hypothetical protein
MIDVVQVGELAQGPEVLAKIPDGALDFSFFPAAGRIAGMREESIFTGEGEESRKEADETTVVFNIRLWASTSAKAYSFRMSPP